MKVDEILKNKKKINKDRRVKPWKKNKSTIIKKKKVDDSHLTLIYVKNIT